MKQFNIGARIIEPTYGVGLVVAIEDAYTRIQFDEHGVKKFLTSLASLESSKVPLPDRLKNGKPRRKRKTAARGRPARSGARMLTPDACEGSGPQLRSTTPPRSSSRGTPPLPAPPALARMSAASAVLSRPANDTALLMERARVHRL